MLWRNNCTYLLQNRFDTLWRNNYCPYLLQNRFDTLWRKHSSYSVGEELFRLPRSEFLELGQIRKELNLLQKLYKLYNDVIDRVSSYYGIPWAQVNIEEINMELMEFQNRQVKFDFLKVKSFQH